MYLQTCLIDCILLQNLPNLETLDLSNSKMLVECPNVAGSPNLKRVTLDNCESLSEVDSSIFLLQKLERLCMSKCTSLKSLSGNTCSPVLGELNALDCTNLQEFSVTFASIDRLALGLSKWVGNELPSSILHTKNLKTFVFPMIESLVDLPGKFADCIWLLSPLNPEHNPLITLHKVLSSPAFMSVKHLNLSNIPNLSEFPDNIFLPKLESLILIDMVIRSFPETIMHLPRLNWLRVYNCKMLQSIPALSQFLPFSIVSNCESLEEVLISSIFEQYHKPNHGFTVLLNCEKLNPHSYHTVLKYAIC
jgi:Leucine-rich repeat (LRR) protein